MAEKHNVIELRDGVIYYTQVGDQNRDTASRSIEAIRLLAQGLSEIKILADYSDSGKMDREALQSGYYAFKNLDFDKLAITGASPYLVSLANAMAHAAGKSKNVHFAKNREAAIAWLRK